MTAAEFLRVLAELVARGNITEAEAAELLTAFEAGDIPAERLPALPSAAQDDDRDRWLLFLLAIWGGDTVRVSAAERKRARDFLRAAFETDIARLAAELDASGDAATWQADMEALIYAYYGQMATAGYGQRLDDATFERMQDDQAEQSSFLFFFAALAGMRLAMGRPLTFAAVVSRATLYGGPGWGEWTRNNGRGELPGWVEQYISRDDYRTCGPCMDRNGLYFLPGVGPMPGEICLGGGYCRCERRLVYDPGIYASLGGV